ncbi:UNVERIFIED_CONTAM: hypothetical protein FKN15_073297 [Acipenser sinensis]
MADRVIFSALAVLLCLSDCSHCYKIEPGVMAGIIATDVVLTVLIVVFVYCLASRRREKKEKGSVRGQQNCKSCYQMDMGAIIGIIIGDIILTVLIALSVFCFANRINKSRLEALKGKSDIKMKGKGSADKQSTYEELQRHRQDIYSDLRQGN